MAVFDVTTGQQGIDRIRWGCSTSWDLVYRERSIFFDELKIKFEHFPVSYALVETKEEAENLIKALQKAIELGWVE